MSPVHLPACCSSSLETGMYTSHKVDILVQQKQVLDADIDIIYNPDDVKYRVEAAFGRCDLLRLPDMLKEHDWLSMFISAVESIPIGCTISYIEPSLAAHRSH